MSKKIFCIGTTSYRHLMEEHADRLYEEGYVVRIPKFDDYNVDELQICRRNIEDIKWADEIHVFWDQRSMGTVFDFGAAFALDKPIKIIYMNPKTFANVMRWYASPQLYQYEVFSDDEEGPGALAPF